MVKEQSPDSFCAEAMADFEEAMQIHDMSYHASYLYLYKRVENADKRSDLLFNDPVVPRRTQSTRLCNEGLVEDQELKRMSDELLKSTWPG